MKINYDILYKKKNVMKYIKVNKIEILMKKLI